MKNYYSILIPIHNEARSIPSLIKKLKPYKKDGHEIIIINDGSTDESKVLLERYSFVKLYSFKQNKGKGVAVKHGLSVASNDHIIIFDGDLELCPSDIKKLMILNIKNNINCVIGNRFENSPTILNIWNIGNIFFSFLFNLIHKTNFEDVLCCAKAFYKKDIDHNKLKSRNFDIDIEILSILVEKTNNIRTVSLEYNRRTKKQGKKLNIFDTWVILDRIIRLTRS